MFGAPCVAVSVVLESFFCLATIGRQETESGVDDHGQTGHRLFKLVRDHTLQTTHFTMKDFYLFKIKKLSKKEEKISF